MSIRTFFISLGDGLYYWLMSRQLREVTSVLDLGCGARSPLSKIPKTFYSLGYDLFPQSIKESKKNKLHDKYIVDDVLKVRKHVPKKSFDAVVALDLIEHLPKKEGEKLLRLMEEVAKKKVIVMTPNGFYKQEPYENNPFQVHKSGWNLDDFQKRGYTVYGIRGLKFLRGEYATIRWTPWFFWGMVSSFSQCVLFLFPSLSYQLFAVKRIEPHQ